MEAFLTTLPPYVHEYLDHYPPTDVFRILRELICFAVLYSENHSRIRQSTREFLQNRFERKLQAVKEEFQYQRDYDNELEDLKFDKNDFNDQTDLNLNQYNNTKTALPEWWNQNEFEQESYEQVEDTKSVTSNHMQRSKSQIILNEGTSRIPASKRHSMINIRAAPSPTPSVKSMNSPKFNKYISRSVSVSPVFDSPGTPILSKFANKIQNNNTGPKMTISASTGTVNMSRSNSIQLKQPKSTATVRARAEHARQQQEELERKKNAPLPGSSISLRIKQRASSGIDWDAIKRERRRTIAEHSPLIND